LAARIDGARRRLKISGCLRVDGWDICGRWFGVVVGATPRLTLTRGSTALTGGSTTPLVLRHDCELWRLSRVQSVFGGTTEIMKEIIGRGLGL
jgi:hypothetical protein